MCASPALVRARFGDFIGDRLQLWCVFAVCVLYALQLWTPLRLTGDSIELLSAASSASEGHGFLNHGQKTHYFPGYPLMVVGLDRIGAARPWGLVTLNVLFLVLAFFSSHYVIKEYFGLNQAWAVWTLLFTALSFVLIKHFTLPLTDIPFFGLSISAVALCVRAEKTAGMHFYCWWGAAVLTSIFAISVRPIGIALVPCLASALSVQFGLRKLLRSKESILIILCSVILLGCSAAVILLRTKYVREALALFTHQGIGHEFRQIFFFRVHEFGEIFLNAPESKLGHFAAAVWFCGAISTLAMLICVWKRIGKMGCPEIYLFAYTCIMLVWPYGDTRFWIPVLPFLFAELFAAIQAGNFAQLKKQAFIVYAAIYVIMGILAMAYSTRITFSGSDFPNRYGDYHLRPTYQLFYSHSHEPETSKVDGTALAILERYSGASDAPPGTRP